MNFKSVVLLASSLTICGSSLAGWRAGTTDTATGMTVNLPFVGRVIGAGNTLYRTSVDVSNNTAGATQVDYYFDGRDTAGEFVTATGSMTNDGLTDVGAGTLRGNTRVHFEDFIDSLAQAGVITAAMRDRGVSGSLMLVFGGFTRSGQGSVAARFWNGLGAGTVGVSLAAREITTEEPRKIVGVVHDTRGGAGLQLYSNVFINNTGLTREGTPAGFVLVELRAVSANSGQDVGRRVTIQVQSGQTYIFGDAASQLQVPIREPVLVFATVTAGDATIHGIITTVDAITRDASAVYMSSAD